MNVKLILKLKCLKLFKMSYLLFSFLNHMRGFYLCFIIPHSFPWTMLKSTSLTNQTFSFKMFFVQYDICVVIMTFISRHGWKQWYLKYLNATIKILDILNLTKTLSNQYRQCYEFYQILIILKFLTLITIAGPSFILGKICNCTWVLWTFINCFQYIFIKFVILM